MVLLDGMGLSGTRQSVSKMGAAKSAGWRRPRGLGRSSSADVHCVALSDTISPHPADCFGQWFCEGYGVARVAPKVERVDEGTLSLTSAAPPALPFRGARNPENRTPTRALGRSTILCCDEVSIELTANLPL